MYTGVCICWCMCILFILFCFLWVVFYSFLWLIVYVVMLSVMTGKLACIRVLVYSDGVLWIRVCI